MTAQPGIISTMAGALRVAGLTVGYGRAPVLEKFNLDVPAGQVIALVGPNGAGKSTLLRSISGLLRAREGQILLNGEDLLGQKPDRIAVRGVLHVAETRDIFPEMSVLENLKVAYDNLGRGEDERSAFARIYDLFPILAERRRLPAGSLSGGQQQMLAIGRALIARPRVLMLDEPSLGLAQMIIQDIYETLSQLRSAGLTILLVEQNSIMAIDFCDHAHVIVNGKIALSGTRSEMLGRGDLIHHYLGGG
jgi:branched-chain amino acid transport system ATP-binding protein